VQHSWTNGTAGGQAGRPTVHASGYGKGSLKRLPSTGQSRERKTGKAQTKE
jgi:hypothetical protein